ncbi:MAG: sodium-dependent transporter [Balneolaceae bacterium]
MTTTAKERFATKWGLILSVLGIAVGTGNIWRFPRIAAQNGADDGAGAFLVAWLTFLFIWSIPLIIAEYGIGRYARRGVIGSFIKVIGEKFAWMGSFVGFVATAIMFYYSVVAGWCLYYLLESVFATLPQSVEQADIVWNGFQNSVLPSLFHGIMIILGGLIILKGVKSIERINKILIPSLLLVLVVSLIRALTLEGSGAGVSYLFTPDWSTLKEPQIWLEALTQNAWDTGAAWGLILTYGAYMKMQDNITVTALQTGIGNNLVSLMAAVIIFSTVFGILGSEMSNGEILAVMQTSGPASTGLTFMWMPQLFNEMPGGQIFAILFFLGLTFAAFSSLIAMIELATKVFVDMGITRKRATIGVCIAGFVFGLPSAVSLDYFVNQDFVWGVGLMVSGGFMSFAVIGFGADKFRRTIVNVNEEGLQLGMWWTFVLKYVVPVQVVSLLAWWIYLSASVEDWYNPLSPFSVATVFVQWAVVMTLFIIYNKQIARKTKLTE